jgi:hypothetical protein
MADAQVAQGIVVSVENTGSPQSYQTIPGVVETPQLSISNTLVEITDLASEFQEHVGTIPNGQLQLTINWLPENSVHAELVLAAEDKERRNFRIKFPDTTDGTTYQFSAIVESISRSGTVAGVLQMSVTLQLQSYPDAVV